MPIAENDIITIYTDRQSPAVRTFLEVQKDKKGNLVAAFQPPIDYQPQDKFSAKTWVYSAKTLEKEIKDLGSDKLHRPYADAQISENKRALSALKPV